MRLAVLLAIAAGSLAGCDAPTPQTAGAPPPPSAPATMVAPAPSSAPAAPPPPRLEPILEGRPAGDSAVTIERCEATGWSYLKCDVAFPVEGRRFVQRMCEDAKLEATIQAIACGRWADYRLRAVGGPHEPEAGVALLEKLCTAKWEDACLDLAAYFAYRDRDLANRWHQAGCGAEGLKTGCRDVGGQYCHNDQMFRDCGRLKDSIDQPRFAATVETATGLKGVGPGTRCSLAVMPIGNATCAGRFSCGDVVVYGRGGSQFPCEQTKADFRGGESMKTGEDGDPALRFDTAKGTFELRDDATGELGAFTLKARFTGK